MKMIRGYDVIIEDNLCDKDTSSDGGVGNVDS